MSRFWPFHQKTESRLTFSESFEMALRIHAFFYKVLNQASNNFTPDIYWIEKWKNKYYRRKIFSFAVSAGIFRPTRLATNILLASHQVIIFVLKNVHLITKLVSHVWVSLQCARSIILILKIFSVGWFTLFFPLNAAGFEMIFGPHKMLRIIFVS